MQEAPYTKFYSFHGVDLSSSNGDTQATGTCPLCERGEGKFSVRLTDGVFHCYHCKASGKPVDFLKALWETLREETNDYSTLIKDRKLNLVSTPLHWGCVWSYLKGQWCIPGHNPDGSIAQLYRYATVEGGRKSLICTKVNQNSSHNHKLFGVSLFNKECETVYLCEGVWDGMAWWEILSTSKETDKGLRPTARESLSLLHNSSVVAVPGCNTFFEDWASLFAGKHVVILYDNDHPDKKGKCAGYEGVLRVANILRSSSSPPSKVSYLQWGIGSDKLDHDPELPHGFDLRDLLASKPDTKKRLEAVEEILNNWIVEVPQSKMKKEKRHTDGKESLQCLPCEDYKSLILSWRKALKWTEGLDHAIAVMLASVASTKSIGDPLWVKVLGPAACLDGDTEIYDPINDTTLTVRERYKKGKRFWVYSRNSLGQVIRTQALPPHRFDKVKMYEVSFSSGKKICVTGGHRFWNGASYVPLLSVLDELYQFGVYHLPTISGTVLKAREQDALHLRKTAQDCQESCSLDSYPCDVLPPLMLDSDRLHAPLLTYAQELCHSLPLDDLDRLYEHSHLYQPYGVQHNYAYTYHTLLSNLQDGTLLPSFSVSSYKPIYLSRVFQHSGIETYLNYTDEQASYIFSSSTNVSYHNQPLLCILPLSHSLPEIEHSRSLQNSPECSGQQWHLSSFERQDVLQQDEILLQPALMPFGLELDSPSESSVSLQTCGLLDRELQPYQEHSEQLEQPLYTSIEKDPSKLTLSILSESDAIVNVKHIGEREYYDFLVPETQNYWAHGFWHHNSGKSTLCEALSVSAEHIIAKSTIRGFHSGFRLDGEDCSLVSQLNGKTLIIKDGDTLLQSPNLSQILSEARDIYDGTSRTHYRNSVSQDYEGLKITFILCGTNALHAIDSSELGERFLTCVIMDEIDDELEDEVAWRVCNRVERSMGIDIEEQGEAANYEPALAEAMALTGGYIGYLKTNTSQKLAEINMPMKARRLCVDLGKFTAYMRARPSTRQGETAEREFAARLVSQYVRLAKCLAFVLNKKEVDDEVLTRVTKVALDSARGMVLAITAYLFEAEEGLEFRSIYLRLNKGSGETQKLLRFLRAIGVITVRHKGNKSTYFLTDRLRELYEEIVIP